MTPTLGHVVLVGAGNMGGAMLRRWPSDARITVVDPAPSAPILSHMDAAGIAHATSPDGVAPADILVLSVKPQLVADVLPGLRGLVAEGTTAVSTIAGTTMETLRGALGCERIVRTIPNTPAMVGEGTTAAFASGSVDAMARERVEALLRRSGAVVWLDDEADIDRATAVSGSGPAYVFHLVEALAAAGASIGLGDEQARALARQTVIGAGALLAQSDEPAGTLRERVTSKGGTTAAALGVLMADDGLRTLMQRAVAAAHDRAIELGSGE